MRLTAASIRVLVVLSVLLVAVGADPGRADAAPSPAQGGLSAFEWYRLSQVNANVTEERLWSLRRDGFSVVYADLGEYLEAADQPWS